MKKSLLAVAALTAFAGAAQAQSSVTIYGLIDVGVMGQTNTGNLNQGTFILPSALSGSGASGGSYVRPGTAFGGMGGGESQSRLGFKGSEDLGGGTKAIFLLETGFNPMTGTVADTGMNATSKSTAGISGDTSLQGQLFGRGAYAGLSNDKYGTLTFGRQQNLMLDNIGGYDPVNAQLFSPLAYSGSYGGGGLTENSRVNQAIKYVWKSNGFNANLLYAPGGVAGSSTAGTTTGAQAGWENAKFGIQAIASHTTDSMNLFSVDNGGSYCNTSGGTCVATPNTLTTGAAIPTGVANMFMNTTAYQITTKWQAMDKLSLKAGYERIILGTPSNFQQVENTSSTPGGYSIGTNYASQVNLFRNVVWAGGNYDFTPAVKGSLGYYYVGTPAYGNGTGASATAGTGVNGTCGNAGYYTNGTGSAGTLGAGGCTGNVQYFSGLVDYNLSKRTNLYAAYNYTVLNGGQKAILNTGTAGSAPAQLAASSVFTSQSTFGIGIRHMF